MSFVTGFNQMMADAARAMYGHPMFGSMPTLLEYTWPQFDGKDDKRLLATAIANVAQLPDTTTENRGARTAAPGEGFAPGAPCPFPARGVGGPCSSCACLGALWPGGRTVPAGSPS